MKVNPLVRPSERRVLVLSMVLILLALAVVNVPFAVTKIRWRMGNQPEVASRVDGAAAASLGWPSSVPHERAWPDPFYRATHRAFGYRDYDVRAESTTPGGNPFGMMVQHLGWPLPVIEIKQMWWDWSNPVLGDPSQGGPEPDPRPMLMPLGLVANPLLIGVPLWLVLVVVPMAWVLADRVRRTRRGDCAWCGYAVGELAVCPECGRQPSGAG